MKVVYLIGEPGIGKSTLMRTFTDQLGPAVEVRKPLAHRYGGFWLELGKRRPAFSGTDSLSMSVQPLAIAWLRSLPADLVLGEGDRLGTRSFMEAVSEFADLRIVALSAPPHVAEQRRAERGHAFDPRWLKSRLTKVERLMDQADVVLDATLSPAELADRLSEAVSR